MTIHLLDQTTYSSKEGVNPWENHLKWLESPYEERFKDVMEILDYWIAGEQKKKYLIFLLLACNYHKKLINLVLVRGDSSGGKTWMVKKVLNLFPEKDVYIFDSATSAALRYDDKLDDIKIIFLRELSPQNEVVDSLKALYDENVVHKETIRVREGNEFKNKVITHFMERRGVITTFSFENVQIDLVNRAWVIIPDQSYSQTQNVIDYQLDWECNLPEKLNKEEEIMKKARFVATTFLLLKWDFTVFIPYMQLLKPIFPNHFLNVRRDVGKLIQLIKIITILNQARRFYTNIEPKLIVSEFADLKAALWVAEDFLTDQILHLDEVKKLILDVIREKDEQYKITPVFLEIKKSLDVSRKTVKRKMDDLFYEGYLNREKTSNTYVYTKLKNYNLVEGLGVDKLEDEINEIVELSIHGLKEDPMRYNK